MSKQRQALEKLISEISEEHAGCGILVWGSVMRGCEGPNSDLDIFVVVEGDGPIRLDQGWQDGRQHLENYVDGVCLDKATMPSETLGKALEKEPFLFWFFARSQIVYDPKGLAKKYHEMARVYFDSHPSVEAVWDENSEIIRRWKPKLKKNPDCGITLPQWNEVANQARKLHERSRT